MCKAIQVRLYTGILFVFFAGGIVFSATEDEQTTKDLERLEEEIQEQTGEQKITHRKETDEKVPSETKFKLDFGGRYSTYFFKYINKDRREDYDQVGGVFYNDLRLEGRLIFARRHFAYIRLRNSYITRRDLSPLYDGIVDDYEGPKLDLAFLSLRCSERSRVSIGRQYFILGKGIAYFEIHDGVQYLGRFFNDNFRLKTFMSRSKPHEHHHDYSLPGYDKKGWRLFSGLEIAYLRNKKLIPYLYYLYEKDHPKEDPIDLDQDYDYSAEYYGLGFTANFSQNLSWWLEVIKEQGESFNSASSSSEKADIDSWAGVTGGKYEFKRTFHPALEFEYAFGSGDKDRLSVTNTQNGNTKRDDTNFIGFGYYFSGYKLNPCLSNIHIYRLGLSFVPLEPFKNLHFSDDVVLGTKFFIYRKDKKECGIYDNTPTLSTNKDIGRELNVYLYWMVKEKTTWWALRYGVFFPGKAYDDSTDGANHYINSSLTIKF